MKKNKQKSVKGKRQKITRQQRKKTYTKFSM